MMKSGIKGSEMDKLIFIPTAILGIIVVLAYAMSCKKQSKSFEINSMVSLFFYSAGIVGSVFIVASSFFPEIRDKLSELNLYILISGAVVFAHSLQGLLREFSQ